MIEIVAEALVLESLTELDANAGVWVTMGAARDMARMRQVSRIDFDGAIARLIGKGLIITVPEENQKTITSADAYNAVTVGTVAHHLVTLA